MHDPFIYKYNYVCLVQTSGLLRTQREEGINHTNV